MFKSSTQEIIFIIFIFETKEIIFSFFMLKFFISKTRSQEAAYQLPGEISC